jgi:hypothetical protein
MKQSELVEKYREASHYAGESVLKGASHMEAMAEFAGKFIDLLGLSPFVLSNALDMAADSQYNQKPL